MIQYAGKALADLDSKNPGLCGASLGSVSQSPEKLAKAQQAVLAAGLQLLDQSGNFDPQDGSKLLADHMDSNGCLNFAGPENRRAYYKRSAVQLFRLWADGTDKVIQKDTQCGALTTSAERLNCFMKKQGSGLASNHDMQYQMMNCSDEKRLQMANVATSAEKYLRSRVAEHHCAIGEAEIMNNSGAALIRNALTQAKPNNEYRGTLNKENVGPTYWKGLTRPMINCGYSSAGAYQIAAALQMQPGFRGGESRFEVEKGANIHSSEVIKAEERANIITGVIDD
jgi:hypothetical protein